MKNLQPKASSESKHHWTTEYQRLDKMIRGFKFDVTKSLRFCKASTMKNEIIKFQKKWED